MSLLDRIDLGILYWLMRLFRAALAALDVVLDLVAGVTVQGGSRAERRRAGERYECSAHLVRILARGNYREGGGWLEKGNSNSDSSRQKCQLIGEKGTIMYLFWQRVTLSLPQPRERPPAAQLRVAARGLRASAVRPVQWSTVTVL